MRQYLDLLQDIINTGTDKADRTGVGTRSVFGRQMRFSLADGFPLMTTKKVFFKGVVAELLFFIGGHTNRQTLTDQGVHIWDAWGDANGNLGPVYGHQWRSFGGKVDNVPQRQPKLRTGLEPTVHGVGSPNGYVHGRSEEEDKLHVTWRGILSRCYNKEADNYPYYGGKGVSVCDRWLEFGAFLEDAPKLRGWADKIADWDGHALDKDVLGNGFLYSPDTCWWASRSENQRAKFNKLFTVEHESGIRASFTDPVDFYKSRGIRQGNFCAMLRGERGSCSGWRLVEAKDLNAGVDQLANAIQTLRTNPDSRRIIVNAWNAAEVDDCALPPCHMMFQFNSRPIKFGDRLRIAEDYGADFSTTHVKSRGWVNPDDWNPGGKVDLYMNELGVPTRALDLQFYMRSVDVFLGLPFNIASYALLTHMVAQITGHAPGEVVWTGGDVHIYQNHFEQVREQLEREPRPLPRIRLNPAVLDIDGFTMADISLDGYDPLPAIKAPVAV